MLADSSIFFIRISKPIKHVQNVCLRGTVRKKFVCNRYWDAVFGKNVTINPFVSKKRDHKCVAPCIFYAI